MDNSIIALEPKEFIIWQDIFSKNYYYFDVYEQKPRQLNLVAIRLNAAEAEPVLAKHDIAAFDHQRPNQMWFFEFV